MVTNNTSITKESEQQNQNDRYAVMYTSGLEEIVERGLYRIHFKPNEKFNCEERGIFYIGFSDIYAYRYIIRQASGFGAYDDDNDKIIAQYSSAKETLLDGWRLD